MVLTRVEKNHQVRGVQKKIPLAHDITITTKKKQKKSKLSNSRTKKKNKKI